MINSTYNNSKALQKSHSLLSLMNKESDWLSKEQEHERKVDQISYLQVTDQEAPLL